MLCDQSSSKELSIGRAILGTCVHIQTWNLWRNCSTSAMSWKKNAYLFSLYTFMKHFGHPSISERILKAIWDISYLSQNKIVDSGWWWRGRFVANCSSSNCYTAPVEGIIWIQEATSSPWWQHFVQASKDFEGKSMASTHLPTLDISWQEEAKDPHRKYQSRPSLNWGVF